MVVAASVDQSKHHMTLKFAPGRPQTMQVSENQTLADTVLVIKLVETVPRPPASAVVCNHSTQQISVKLPAASVRIRSDPVAL